METEQRPLVFDEDLWGFFLRLLVEDHKFRNRGLEPSRIEVVMVEEYGGIEVHFVPQVREVPVDVVVPPEPVESEVQLHSTLPLPAENIPQPQQVTPTTPPAATPPATCYSCGEVFSESDPAFQDEEGDLYHRACLHGDES